jgi:hypothetical protein
MSIELLENRIAPAALFLNSKSASFSDSDGDLVTVSFSKPILTQANLASVLSDGPTPAIDLTGLGKDAKGFSLAHLSGISFSVKKGASGDGFASIASINASGIDLSSISGSKVSLGSLSVGDATVDPTTKVLSDPTPKSPALGALSVRAFGATPGAPLFINPRTATYTDTGGDIVTVSFSKSVLTPGNVAGVFVQGGDGGLQTLDLTGVGKNAAGVSLAQGANISFSLKKGLDSAGKPTVGDGFASVGAINASGLDLGTITGTKIRLGSLSVGDATMDGATKVVSDPTPKTAPLGALNVASFGVAGAPRWINAKTATYTDAGGDVVTVSLSKGLLTPGNVASVLVQGGDGGLQKLDLTALGKNAAGTSLAQGANVTVAVKKATGDGMAHIGFINAQGIDLGAVSAARSDLGRILVGDGVDAVLHYYSDPEARTYPYGGIIEPTPKSASIRSLSVASMGTQGLATQGGSGDLVSVFYGEAGTLAIKGDVVDASLEVRRSFARIDIGGSLVGHDQPGQGSIKTEMSSTQKEVDVGDILSERLSGPIRIGGNLTGGSGSETGYISTTTRLGSIKSISIGGDLNGGSGSKSGAILVEREGGIGSLAIKGSVNGGGGFQSGYVYSGDTATLSIGGDIKGGTGNSSGGIEGDGISNRLTVGGSIRGGNITSEGVTLVKSGFIDVGGANVATIKGSLIAGINDTLTSSAQVNGSVIVRGDTRSLTVGGSLVGNVGAGGKVNFVTLNAGASSTYGEFTKIAVNGSATHARITNGLISSDNFTSGDPGSKNGSITIGGDFMSSSISIGIGTGADGFLGTADDLLPAPDQGVSLARIASIIIKGNAGAAPGSGDSYVIQAERIDQLIVKGAKIPLTPGNSNDNSTFGGINIRELARAVAS